MTETAEKPAHTWWASPRFLLSAAAVVLLVFIGLILFLTTNNADETGDGGAAPAPSSDVTRAPTTAAAAADSQDSVCGLEANGGVTLTAAPKNVEWEFLNGIFGPKSDEHGPGVVESDTGVRSCFSHTPEGALLAVAGFFATSGDPQLFLHTVEKQVIDGPGKDKNLLLIQRRIEEDDTTAPPVAIAGFRLLAYDDDQATVELVLSADAGQETLYQTQSADIIWQNGDWYFQVRENGEAGSISGQINNLTGYVPWGPSNG